MPRNITQHYATRKAGSEDSDTHRAQNKHIEIIETQIVLLIELLELLELRPDAVRSITTRSPRSSQSKSRPSEPVRGTAGF